MRLRYAQLQRRQEQMIAEMERAIYKRDNIEAKGKVSTQRKGAPPTQAVLAKQVADLTQKLQLTTHDANLTQLNVLKLQEGQTATAAEVESKAEEIREMQGQVRVAEDALLSQQQKQAVQDAMLGTQARLASRVTRATQGSYMPLASEELLRDRIAEADDTSARLLTVVESLSQEHPQHATVFSAVVQAVTAV